MDKAKEKKSPPKSDKTPEPTADSMTGINEVDKEEFENREKNSRKAAEGSDMQKGKRIQDNEFRDDDDGRPVVVLAGYF